MLNILIALKEPPPDEILELLNEHSVNVLPPGESPADAIKKSPCDLVIIEDAPDILKSLKAADPRVEVILAGEDIDAVEALRQGASAVFGACPEASELKKSIDRIVELKLLRKEIGELEGILSSKYTFEGVVGKNPNMLEIFNFITRIAPYCKTVTIMGETGTGKEVIARALHNVSPVAKSPFVVFNCGGVVENLIESELFGHKKGAFTGAVSDKAGLFESAGEGTLFLDEIGEMPLSVQPHLLRVLQDGEFRRLGSNQTMKARCRVVAATNRDLSEEVKKGRFRDDLFFRLTPLTIKVPPLRDRREDIPLILRAILRKFSQRTGKKMVGVSRPAQAALLSYDWPGNVRELENVIERAAILTRETFVGLEDISPYIVEGKGKGHYADTSTSLDEMIKRHIEAVLKQFNGNRTRAAQALGMTRRSLLRKLEKYSIS